MNEKRKKRDDIYELVSYNIKKYRKTRKITQAQLAELTQYSHEFIRRIEAPNCKKSFSIDAISHIADALDIEIQYLFEKKN